MPNKGAQRRRRVSRYKRRGLTALLLPLPPSMPAMADADRFVVLFCRIAPQSTLEERFPLSDFGDGSPPWEEDPVP